MLYNYRDWVEHFSDLHCISEFFLFLYLYIHEKLHERESLNSQYTTDHRAEIFPVVQPAPMRRAFFNSWILECSVMQGRRRESIIKYIALSCDLSSLILEISCLRRDSTLLVP